MKDGNNMRWLVWKEYRQNRLIVFVMLFLLLFPYLVWPAAVYCCWRWKVPLEPGEEGIPYWLVWLFVANLYSLGTAQLGMALIGGNAIAGERVDRSAEFQAFLPIPQHRILKAKLLLAVLMVAVIWLPNASLFCCFRFADMLRPPEYRAVLEVSANIAITGLTLFCVAWFFSSVLSSPVIAIFAGLVTPLAVLWTPWLYWYHYGVPANEIVPVLEAWYRSICLLLSSLGFGVGTWLYLRRVEP